MSTTDTTSSWSAVEAFVFDQLDPEDADLAAARQHSEEEGLPAIAVSALEGRFLELVARISGATRVLEIGTLGGYSTICLARAVGAGGTVVSLELDEHHAQVARTNLERAGLGDRVEVIVGSAHDTLAALDSHEAVPFDLVFVDADKRSTPAYVSRALELVRPGAVLIVDNVVRDGRLAVEGSGDADIDGMREFVRMMGDSPRLHGTVIQTVGSRGYDGFALVTIS